MRGRPAQKQAQGQQLLQKIFVDAAAQGCYQRVDNEWAVLLADAFRQSRSINFQEIYQLPATCTPSLLAHRT